MFDAIVVPVDGSGFGELALPRALGIACKSGGEVRLVTVITPIPASHGAAEDEALESERLVLARERAEGYMADLQRRVILSGCDVPISCHVEVGPVVDALDAHARSAGADLLVMTTHGWGPLRRAWLGSVADGLLRRTPCPILAIRPRDGEKLDLVETEFRHVLVTLDGSSESREILPFARALSHMSGARMTLLRVIPPHFPLASPFTSHASHEFQGLDGEEVAVKDSLEKEAEALREEGFSVGTEIVAGVPAPDGILEFALANQVEVVAMATHGRGGVARLILGSVADKVIRGGNLPVLLHRAP
ncbi:MAG: universal stress protein [Longimicrobiales bacterium]